MIVTVTRAVRNEGTIIVLEGTTANGHLIQFAADHRPANAIIEALDAGEDVRCEIAPWQVLAMESNREPQAEQNEAQ